MIIDVSIDLFSSLALTRDSLRQVNLKLKNIKLAQPIINSVTFFFLFQSVSCSFLCTHYLSFPIFKQRFII